MACLASAGTVACAFAVDVAGAFAENATLAVGYFSPSFIFRCVPPEIIVVFAIGHFFSEITIAHRLRGLDQACASIPGLRDIFIRTNANRDAVMVHCLGASIGGYFCAASFAVIRIPAMVVRELRWCVEWSGLGDRAVESQ